MPAAPEPLPARGPLLTAEVHRRLLEAVAHDAATLECSVDLGRSTTTVTVTPQHWEWQAQRYPYPERCKERTVYYWSGAAFEPVARYGNSLIKLVPTEWGPPTFEIDGVKMLPTRHVSPMEDARHKVSLVEPRGRRVLDTCGGLGYFAACCIEGGATLVQSYEINPDVLWLRSLNPWSPAAVAPLELIHGDISQALAALPDRSFNAILHDPPRFGLAGELYSQAFYDQLARVLQPNGRLFHYTGTPNRLTSGRDVPQEVAGRLRLAGFRTRLESDGVLAIRQSR
ncbi:MAG: MnmC family methyltransferase [Gammaproteobacteria bacterium]|nr:MnmC family methyltransferase [Gammaproteobacteria bacterium]MDH5227682.1 MnmC family methyltransferase [Gammaproteobacteria bacterium]